MSPKDQTKFNVLRNALYHTSRRLTYERWSRWCNFAVILLGATAVSSVGQVMHGSWLTTATGLLTAAVGAVQLVFDFGGKARDHQSLQRDYYHLLAEITLHTDATDQQIAGWDAAMTRIACTEPPIMRALDAKAYNDALSGSGLAPEDRRIVIPFLHRIFGQFWAYEGYAYKHFYEIETKR